LRSIVLASFIAAFCSPSLSLAKAKARGPARDTGEAELPAICRQTAQPLDAAGLSSLADLQKHLVHDVLGDKVTKHDDGWFNAMEVRGFLRGHPSAEMAFLFPAPVAIPKSGFRVRTDRAREDLDGAPHIVVYIELSKVQMVRLGSKLGLVLFYGAGPTGTRPKGIYWLWGESGQFCALRRKDGSWHAYPIGAVGVS